MKNVILLAAAVFLLLLAGGVSAVDVGTAGMRNGTTVTIQSGGQSYPAYITTPEDGGPYPAVVLIHSFNGLEPGYQVMVDRLATEGFVVIAPEWQTFEEAPADNVTEALVRDTVAYLETRPEVNSSSIGLTGFCAGGRYTMLFLPRIEEFSAGVAWYGFPYSGGQANGTPPAEFVENITGPMLIIHGTADEASPVADIYRYATDLDAAGKYFELKVYQGEPHGFMIGEDGELVETPVAESAYEEMAGFFNQRLAGA
ncbi:MULTISPECIES: dienelactone hydrolase family protein [Methanoculleus]|uniref:Dienelactone hydrolase n=2 Tax=Methanoculleus TaxID=45989 RepID=A3CTZ7_METMJ|nr:MULTISPECIES: dienelactone hydrolase family protein [Methanoculleus]ABN56847.1 dienelactone hydrolase [Methanoculleus marisnigri JR1]UYU18275.1 dienelactone hydrolase family protein [Methanoculleus submarinus]